MASVDCIWKYYISAPKSSTRKLISQICHRNTFHLTFQSHEITGPDYITAFFPIKIDPLFSVTHHMVEVHMNTNRNLCFVTQFQAVGVNEYFINRDRA